MKILIVEDQPDKKQNIENFILDNFSNLTLNSSNSLRGAIREITYNSGYDLILLDMSMPAFDPSESYIDDSPESYAGKELMDQMILRGINTNVIVVTQFSSFEGGEVVLESLSDKFKNDYEDFYKGYIYYNSASNNWKKELKIKIKNIMEDNKI